MVRGKSLIRKILPGRVTRELEGADAEPKHIVASVSMERRTSYNMDILAMNAFTHDTSWDPTSLSTYTYIKGLLGMKNRFLVIDEPEIGMSEESQLLICKYINETYEKNKDNFLGMLVITHSKTIVRNLSHDQFLNLEGMSEDVWVNRVPSLPKDLTFEDLREQSHQLYLEVENRAKQVKKSKE